MMLEVPSGSERGFLYIADGDCFSGRLDDHIRLKQVFSKTYDGLRIVTVEIFGYHFETSEEKDDVPLPAEIGCIHGNNMIFRSINPLPHDGWEELVDCWSCHDCEFKTMLSLVPTPRKNGVLVSSLFLLINDADLPLCCRKDNLSVRKLFYNEITLRGYTHHVIIYLYLDLMFRDRDRFLFSIEQKSYEVRYFYKAMLISIRDGQMERKEALKVGIKETTRMVPDNSSINGFYLGLMYDSIAANSINVEVFGYRVSFLTKEPFGRWT